MAMGPVSPPYAFAFLLEYRSKLSKITVCPRKAMASQNADGVVDQSKLEKTCE